MDFIVNVILFTHSTVKQKIYLFYEFLTIFENLTTSKLFNQFKIFILFHGKTNKSLINSKTYMIKILDLQNILYFS